MPINLSSDMRDFVTRTLAFFPASLADQGVTAERSAYLAMCDAFPNPLPHNLHITNESVSTPTHAIPIRCYEPTTRHSDIPLLFIHGGGWYLGNLDSHHAFTTRLAHDLGVTLIAVDYRLAPEHPFPAALEDVSTVYRWLTHRTTTTPILIGDSAGANLIAAFTLQCREENMPMATAQCLIYPALAPSGSLPSHRHYAEAPLLSKSGMDYCWSLYHPTPAASPLVTPLNHPDLSHLPPALIYPAEYDPLQDDGVEYARKLRAADVPCTLTVGLGMVHGGLRAIGLASEADHYYQDILSGIRQHL